MATLQWRPSFPYPASSRNWWWHEPETPLPIRGRAFRFTTPRKEEKERFAPALVFVFSSVIHLFCWRTRPACGGNGCGVRSVQSGHFRVLCSIVCEGKRERLREKEKKKGKKGETRKFCIYKGRNSREKSGRFKGKKRVIALEPTFQSRKKVKRTLLVLSHKAIGKLLKVEKRLVKLSRWEL